jgi:aspartyl-tRNA(Asn)/glutamyl-tRNA(Gln) amidotransferase subunit A
MNAARPELLEKLPPLGATALPATELASKLACGILDPREVIDEFLARAIEVNGHINCFTYLFPEESRQRAETSAERIAAGRPRALEGVPIAIKELTPVAGQPHTLGSVFLKDAVATQTDPSVASLLEAGAIPFARTNSPEFGCASVTDNLLFGQTRNPWNSAYSTAGSSGGAAAALASFAAPLAQGTDSAGSLRMPAAACGVVGFKPSYGVVPTSAPDYLDVFGHSGPMARSVADVILMFDLMAGEDPAHLQWHPTRPARLEMSLPDLSIGMISSIPGLTTHADVESNLLATAERLRESGATVCSIGFPWPWERLFGTVKLAFGAVYMPLARRLRDIGAPLSNLTLGFIDDVEPVTRDYGYAVDARAEIAQLQEDIGAVMSSVDLLMMPTLQVPAPVADEHFLQHGPIIGGVPSADRWIVAFTVPFNLASTCPAVTLPNGVSEEGTPTAVQLIGQPYRDRDLLRWAAEIEKLLGCSPIPVRQ